jgi:hypothetical protein
MIFLLFSFVVKIFQGFPVWCYKPITSSKLKISPAVLSISTPIYASSPAMQGKSDMGCAVNVCAGRFFLSASHYQFK